MFILKMPKFGLSMESGTISKWYKKEGEPIKKDEPIVEVESEKITNDIPSPVDGFLKKIVVEEGQDQKVGEVIAYIAENKEELEEEVEEEKKVEEVVKEEKVEQEPQKIAVKEAQEGFIKASPRAKRLAKEKGIDLHQVRGTGPNGRIVEKDVLAFAKAQGTVEEGVEEPISAVRKTIIKNLSESYRNSVLVTNMTKIDMTELLKLREEWKKEEKVSVTAILVKIVSEVLKKLSKFNVLFDGEKVKKFNSINIGVAVDTEKGLVVPVIKNVGTMNIREINKELKRISDAAKSEKIGLDDLQGSHFTITNLGMMRTDMFTPILNGQEVAILGVGRTTKEVKVMDDNSFAVREMSWFSLSYDHRIIDGADAARFLGELSGLIELNLDKIKETF